jgi:hypothetical protein
VKLKLAFAGVALATSAIMSVAAMAQPALAGPAKGPGPKGERYTGALQEAGNSSWCVTAPSGATDHDVIFLARCVPGDAHQIWHCVKFTGIGECGLLASKEYLDIGQWGSLDTARVVDPNKPVNKNFILHFNEVNPSRYTVSNIGYHGNLLAMPIKVVKPHVYQLHWFKSTTRGYYYTLIIKFQPDPAVAAS